MDFRGNAKLPARENQHVESEEGPSEEAENAEYDERTPLDQRLKQRFARQLSPLIVTKDAPCPYLAGEQAGRPVYIFVHGIRGAGVEWWPVIPTLAANHPDAMYLFGWNPTQQRVEIIEALVTGINRIAACHPNGPTVVLAHSAGGMVAAYAVSRLAVESGPGVDVFTVASPLSGAGLHNKAEDEEGENRFMKDLGATKTGFPAAAANVRVTHLRTQYPADQTMEPKFKQHAPNEVGVGVEGATQIDLPDTLTHDGSLLFVARQWVAH